MYLLCECMGTSYVMLSLSLQVEARRGLRSSLPLLIYSPFALSQLNWKPANPPVSLRAEDIGLFPCLAWYVAADIQTPSPYEYPKSTLNHRAISHLVFETKFHLELCISDFPSEDDYLPTSFPNFPGITGK